MGIRLVVFFLSFHKRRDRLSAFIFIFILGVGVSFIQVLFVIFLYHIVYWLFFSLSFFISLGGYDIMGQADIESGGLIYIFRTYNYAYIFVCWLLDENVKEHHQILYYLTEQA